MLRGSLVIVVGLIAAAAAGFAGCRLLHIDPHPQEMLLAAIIAAVCAAASVSLLLLTFGATQSAAAHAGLMATAAHMIACLLVAGAVIAARLASPVPLLLWMLPMYWITLTGLVLMILNRIKNPTTTIDPTTSK